MKVSVSYRCIGCSQALEAEKQIAEKSKEIERLLLRIDTLEGASERFMQAKERQDNEIAMLNHRNRELLAQVLDELVKNNFLICISIICGLCLNLDIVTGVG